MSEFKGTPGPWFIRNEEIQSVGTDHKMTAMCYGTENANLIAAAPELLEALLDLKFKLYGLGNASPKIEQAIKKALGQ